MRFLLLPLFIISFIAACSSGETQDPSPLDPPVAVGPQEPVVPDPPPNLPPDPQIDICRDPDQANYVDQNQNGINDHCEDADDDGFSLVEDCDDNRPDLNLLQKFYRDSDEDNYPDDPENASVFLCEIERFYTVEIQKDNCPDLANPDQIDNNANAIGDACEDSDGDDYSLLEDCNDQDAQVYRQLDLYIDTDLDGYPDNPNEIVNECIGAAIPDDRTQRRQRDNCPALNNPRQRDDDRNNIGDACQDLDGDRVVALNDCDDNDANFNISARLYLDTDRDSLPNNNRDSVIDCRGRERLNYTELRQPLDNCPFAANPLQEDADDDGRGDACDENIVQIGLGQGDSEKQCVLTEKNNLFCQGFGAIEREANTIIESFEIASNHICMITSENNLFCSAGEDDLWLTSHPEMPEQASQLSLSENQTCVIDLNNRVICQAEGNIIYKLNPLPDQTFEQVDSGVSYACAITNRSKIYCLGSDQAFLSEIQGPSLVEFNLEAGEQLIDIQIAERHACVLTNRGRLHCWGDNNPLIQNPVVEFETSFSRIEISNSMNCVLDSLNNQVLCWTAFNGAVPVRFDLDGLEIVDFSLAEDRVCLVSDQGNLHCSTGLTPLTFIGFDFIEQNWLSF